MSKMKNFIMQVEDKVYEHLTEDMVAECEHISELYSKVEESMAGESNVIFGMFDDIVRDICDDAWNEYWSKYAQNRSKTMGNSWT